MFDLKLRTIASKKGGRFYLSDAINVLQLTERTTKKHLSNLSYITKTANGYKLSFPTELSVNRKSTFVLISHQQLFSYSWKNIGKFHAYLSEIEIERYKRHQKAKVKGYKVFNQKDKIFEVIKDGKNSQFHNLQSIECSSLVIKKSNATISRYKKVQNVSTYKSVAFWSFEPKFYLKNGTFNFKKFLSENKGSFVQSKDSFYFQPISKRTTSIIIKFG